MTHSDFNAQEYKERQRKDWDAVSAGWEVWWDTLESGAKHITQRLLHMGGVENGHQVLDIATGIGEPALSAACRVGPQGRVVATDQANGMLDIARRRAAQQGLENLTFLQTDGEDLNGIEPGFDVVLCRWGLMFFPDAGSALSRVHNVLKPGGRLSAAVWSSPERVPSISLAMRVVADLVKAPPPPPDTPSPFALADRDALRRLFADAGFRDLSTEYIPVTFTMPSAQAYTAFTQDIAAPVVTLVNEQPPEARDEIWAAVTDAVSQFAVEDGSIQLENEALCIVGTR